jgi:hypothetical protein
MDLLPETFLLASPWRSASSNMSDFSVLRAPPPAPSRDSGPALPSHRFLLSHYFCRLYAYTITGVGFSAWPVGDGAMIVRYSPGHIFRYPHPELLSPIVKFVIF